MVFPMTQASRFHLAFPVHDLALARHFYGTVLGCPEGRSASDWVDFDLFGHQIVAHLAPDECHSAGTNPVDGDLVPVRHFGLILNMDDWRQLADHLSRQSITFLIKPHVRFAGETGEQATFFVHDPSGNALEFKAFADIGQLFAR
jgi:extradiol dioxygenase family protein